MARTKLSGTVARVDVVDTNPEATPNDVPVNTESVTQAETGFVGPIPLINPAPVNPPAVIDDPSAPKPARYRAINGGVVCIRGCSIVVKAGQILTHADDIGTMRNAGIKIEQL